MGDGHALGRARGTRGEDHVGEVIGATGVRGCRPGEVAQIAGWVQRIQDWTDAVKFQAGAPGRQQQVQAAFRGHLAHPGRGQIRVQGHVGRAGLQDAQQGRIGVQAAGEPEAHQGPAAQAAPVEPPGDVLGPCVEFRVGAAVARLLAGWPVGMAAHGRGEELGQGLPPREAGIVGRAGERPQEQFAFPGSQRGCPGRRVLR